MHDATLDDNGAIIDQGSVSLAAGLSIASTDRVRVIDPTHDCLTAPRYRYSARYGLPMRD